MAVARAKTGSENAGVDSRHEEAGWTSREWTKRHEETGVDNAGVSDRKNNVLLA